MDAGVPSQHEVVRSSYTRVNIAFHAKVSVEYRLLHAVPSPSYWIGFGRSQTWICLAVEDAKVIVAGDRQESKRLPEQRGLRTCWRYVKFLILVIYHYECCVEGPVIEAVRMIDAVHGIFAGNSC